MGNKNQQENVDRHRRKFLMAILVGGGAFLAEKALRPLFSFLKDQPPQNDLLNSPGFHGFKIAERRNGLSVYDSSGEEVFQIDSKA